MTEINKHENIEDYEGVERKVTKKIQKVAPNIVEQPILPVPINNVTEMAKKPRKKPNFILTEARKLAFEKARETRLQNIESRKQEKELLHEEEKKLINSRIVEKAKQIESKQKKIQKVIEISDSSESEESVEIVYVKKKKQLEPLKEYTEQEPEPEPERKPVRKFTNYNKNVPKKVVKNNDYDNDFFF
jgi:hypothetical protein